ncbi:O-antigen polysaccharide polymerase Wzy [bacterium]|nr:O-antigen polysaccharide polymerase Wzy [bacterium]
MINLTIYIFFFISVIPCFYILYSNIIDNNNIGYAERVLSDINRTVGFNSYSILLLLSAFFIPSLLGLYVIKKWKIAIPITILYIIMYFKSGSRMLIFCLILTLIFIYLHFYMRKASTKKILAILCLLFLSIFSMVFVSKFRSNEKISHLKISELMELGVEQTFSQTGTIFASTAIVLEECPKNIDFSYGKTYISTFAYVLPNYLTKNYPEKNGYVDTTFAKSLSDYGNIGSSFIAECYYNFGYLSILLMPIFAILWIYLNKFITESHSNLFTTFGLYIFYYVTITIRSEGVQLLRYILWYFVPFFVIYFLLKKMKGLRNKKCQNIV